jgi:uncharacterized membrane protein
VLGFKSKQLHQFLWESEKENIQQLIKTAEQNTSGEIRIYIESKCKYTDTLQRAEEIFSILQMNKTEFKNAVLIYIAYEDREFAIYGDHGCITTFPKQFWKNTAKALGYHFFKKEYNLGMQQAIKAIQVQLEQFYPYTGIKKNDLPDEIVFGK